jgi:hypothetical protein
MQKSVESIVATLRVLMESGVEELKVLQTILLLITTTDVVQGKPLSKVGGALGHLIWLVLEWNTRMVYLECGFQ